MAEGLLLVLIGEECKKKEKYLKLDKEYEFQVLFGFATDTYDTLGKIKHSIILTNCRIDKLSESIKKEIKKFRGSMIQKYPMYSSKTIKGKPLFSYARGEKEVEVPEREIYIKELKFLKVKKIQSKKLLKSIIERIKKVKGDFRQKEILKLWQKNLKNKGLYFIADFKIKCSSGTYVRSIANYLGEELALPTLAFSIKRTKIGKWSKISL
jgi:tRNA pseudouridine55 synthase